jgi:hypothetical protein
VAIIKIQFNGQEYEIDEQALAEAIAAIQEKLEALADGDIPEEQIGTRVDPATGEILDSWEQLITSVTDGTYTTKYSVGSYKSLDLGTEGVVNMQIAAMDADALSEGSGNARITWIAKELLSTKNSMNGGTNANTRDGWSASGMRTYLSNDIYALIPETVRNAIVSVDKTYWDYTTKSTLTCSDKLWIPSYREVWGGLENSGVIYSKLFTDDISRIKTLNGSSDYWWLRSAASYSEFCKVDYEGEFIRSTATMKSGVALGFCM